MQLYNLILSALLLWQLSCSTTKYNTKNLFSPVSSGQISPNVIEKAQGSGAVKLLNHQLFPIQYMLEHPDQKGIIINHYMGTGKTYLALGFAQSYPDRPVIVLAPGFLKSHWKHQIESYGVTDPKRIKFVSYADAPRLLKNKDLSKHVLLVDEAHNLIKYLRSPSEKANAEYTEIYSTLRKAYKVIALTGTPLYADESDLAYLVNLVSDKDEMPFNQETFRLEYTSDIPVRKLFRGYLTESNSLTVFLPMFLTYFGGALYFPWGMIGGAVLGFAPVAANLKLDLSTYRLRQFDAKKLEPILSKYFSYFRFDETKFKDFPQQEFQITQVPYSREQYSFFLHLVEGDLDPIHLRWLLANEKKTPSAEYLKVNSTKIHEDIYNTPGSARDIGNFAFKKPSGEIIEPPKFEAIYDHLLKHNDQTVLYSNYYQTGILSFADYLKRKKYPQKFAIIEPSLEHAKVASIVDAYNRGEIRLLLLHPEITEGISLKGTQYLHILEPMLNSAVLEQVIGRTRRYQSHSHLPPEKQTVHITVWQSKSGNWDPGVGDIKRANWFKRYGELSYMSRWGLGLHQIDKNYGKKQFNPEELSLLKMETLEKNLQEIQKTLMIKSIEANR